MGGPKTNHRSEHQAAEQRQKSIRRAAYSCFRDHGYHETTVDSICVAAGIAKGTLYWYYPSKQAVFVDILETWAREIMEELYKQFEDAVAQKDWITALTDALEREIPRGRAIVPLWLEFTVHARREEEIRGALARFYARARSAIAEMLRSLVGRRLSETEVRGIAAALFGFYTGIILQDLTDPIDADATDVARRLMPVLRRLLQPMGGAAPSPKGKRGSGAARGKPAASRSAPKGARISRTKMNAFLVGTPPATISRLQRLRKLVLQIAPGADERIVQGRKYISYDQSGLFCYIKPGADVVVLGFHQGTRLPDPQGLLKGKGKRMRHTTIPVKGAMELEHLTSIICAALALQGSER